MPPVFRILIVDDDPYALQNFKLGLKDFSYELVLVNGYQAAVEQLKDNEFHLLITDLKMPYKSGLDLAEYVINNNLIDEIILVTGYGDEPTIERAIKLGFRDFIRKPYEEVDLQRSVEKIYRNYLLKLENEELKKKLQVENKILKEQISKELPEKFNIIGKSRALGEVLKKAEIIARYSTNCLLQGESGTGKELLARFIHQNGPRKDAPFIPVNCAALSPTLFEAELFGYIKGAFTGANETKPGLFEVANHGILFLDEISEIPENLQAKLLRVIEEQKIRRIGDNKFREIDVQVIASTNRSMKDLESEKFIRKDLFHRIGSAVLELPPLRERKEDLPELVDYYYRKYAKLYNTQTPPPDARMLEEIKKSDWPGNIRQLSNFIQNYVLFYELNSTPDYDGLVRAQEQEEEELGILSFTFIKGTMEEIEEAKKLLVQKILKLYNYNKSKAARHLGITYPGLIKMMERFGIANNGEDNRK